jgi:hypothetical protein
MGMTREEDVPGWMIPERYFRFQRDRDARALVGIFRHNALDIVSMASLATRMVRAYDEPTDNVHHALDWVSLGSIYERSNDLARAVWAWEQALRRQLSPAEVHETLWRLSLAAKRLGDWERAVRVWHDLVASTPRHVGPYVELAKYYEHRTGQPAEAARHVGDARQRVADGGLERYRRGAVLAELDYRLQRLERRLARIG